MSTSYYLESELYDVVYGDFVADIPLHTELVRGAGGPALEVCCGTGRLLVPVLEAGLACDGLDLMPDMLAALRAKLTARGLDTTLFLADMRTFRLEQRYALIVIPFNSFLHNLTQADQIATLRNCREHLLPGGRLVVIAFQPSAAKLLEWDGAEKFLKEVPAGDGRLRVHDRADDDRVEQLRRMTRRLEFIGADGRVTREERLTFVLRYVYKPEMELLLRTAGFARWQVQPWFTNYADPSSLAGDRAPREGDNLCYTAWAS